MISFGDVMMIDICWDIATITSQTEFQMQT